jgi:hypothetical protein
MPNWSHYRSHPADKEIYFIKGGKIIKKPILPIPPSSAQRKNYLIVGEYGDWSGFRTLEECTAQLDELVELSRENSRRSFKIVERI